MNNCIQCNKEFKPHSTSTGKYCSNVCQREFQYNETITNWLDGKIKGWTGLTRQLCNWVKRYIYDLRGTACEECGWDKRHPIDGAILTEIDHIDGDTENCVPSNLKVLCPNCHSMTHTFRARNKNSKRNR